MKIWVLTVYSYSFNPQNGNKWATDGVCDLKCKLKIEVNKWLYNKKTYFACCFLLLYHLFSMILHPSLFSICLWSYLHIALVVQFPNHVTYVKWPRSRILLDDTEPIVCAPESLSSFISTFYLLKKMMKSCSSIIDVHRTVYPKTEVLLSTVGIVYVSKKWRTRTTGYPQ